MSYYYFISPPEVTDLSVDPIHLAEQVKARWPDAEFVPLTPSDPDYSLEWIIRGTNGEMRATLDTTRQVIAMRGIESLCTTFTVWYRGQVPDRYPLVFYDEGLTQIVGLHPGVTEARLLESISHL